MLILRQSSAIDIRMGPFVDATDGVTPETGITLGAADQAEVLKENGAATVTMGGTFAAITGADGWYDYTVATGDVDTVGEVVFVVQDSSVCLPVYVRAFVVEEAIYDLTYNGGATALVTLAAATHTGAVIPNVTLVATTTALTNAVASVAGAVGSVTGNVDGNVTGSVGSNLELGPTEVNAQVADVMKTDTIAERASGAPTATPTFEEAISYLYMMLTNKIDVDSGFKEFNNNGGTVIWKKALSDDSSNYIEANGESGP